MREITVETSLSDKLAQATGQTLLCDPEGRALGFFSPIRDRPKASELQLEPPSTIEEIMERRKNRNGNFGRPLDEILKDLGIE
jgi:hypothetical protein